MVILPHQPYRVGFCELGLWNSLKQEFGDFEASDGLKNRVQYENGSII